MPDFPPEYSGALTRDSADAVIAVLKAKLWPGRVFSVFQHVDCLRAGIAVEETTLAGDFRVQSTDTGEIVLEIPIATQEMVRISTVGLHNCAWITVWAHQIILQDNANGFGLDSLITVIGFRS